MPSKKSYLTATDLFCGAGGSTTGAKQAGFEMSMAINHWQLAVETHNTNHPEADHDCRDVQATDPRRYPSTDILIASPECTNQSNANGKKKKATLFFQPDASDERSRATMWDVCRFTEFHKYNCIIVENVVEARKWVMWDAWLQAMHSMGYEHKACYLNSMHFPPCPQSRDRLYVVFWRKGNKAPDLEYKPKAYCECCEKEVESYQWWRSPKKKWGKYGERNQYLYRCCECTELVEPYYFAAFNVIDWSLPGERIGDRQTPLKEKTMKRIVHGLEKYGRDPLIITNGYSSGVDCRVKRLIDKAFSTQTGDLKNSCLLHPFITNAEHGRVDHNMSLADPIHTQTSAHTSGIVHPFICELNSTGKARSTGAHISTVLASGNHHLLVSNYSPGWARPISREGGTVTASDGHALLSTPFLVENYGQSKSRSIEKPIGAITTQTNHGVISSASLNSFLTYYYSSSQQTSRITEAVRTVTAQDRAALVTSNGINVEDCLYRTLKWHEIRRAMAFCDQYVVLGTVKEKVKQLGNAVTPPAMEWLAGQCRKSLEK